MILNKKQKNRRFERDNVLEVKMHSKHVRAVRWRRFRAVLGWSLGVTVGGLLVWRGSEWALKKFVYANPTFAIQKIDVHTDGVIPVDRLRQWTGVRAGDNLFAVDLQRVRRDLKLNSVVREAAVDRVLPNTLWVRVTEREPLAQFTAWQQLAPNAAWSPVTFYLDDEGFLLLPSDLPKLSQGLAQHFEALPKLNGALLAEFAKGKPVESPRIRAALKLILAFQESPMAALAAVSEIDLSTPGVLVVATRQNGSIVFGFEDLAAQLRRWRAVHDFAAGAGKGIATLDLSVSNNVPARWLEASAVPPLPPKATKPLRHRKKNV